MESSTEQRINDLQQDLSTRLRLTEPPKQWDWHLHDGNAHYCNEKVMFSSYTMVNRTVSYNGARMSIAGIGTVDLRVSTGPQPDGTEGAATRRITLCLHIPDAPSNGLSKQRLLADAHDVQESAAMFSFREESGRWLYYGYMPSRRVAVAGEIIRGIAPNTIQPTVAPIWSVHISRGVMEDCVAWQRIDLEEAENIWLRCTWTQSSRIGRSDLEAPTRV